MVSAHRRRREGHTCHRRTLHDTHHRLCDVRGLFSAPWFLPDPPDYTGWCLLTSVRPAQARDPTGGALKSAQGRSEPGLVTHGARSHVGKVNNFYRFFNKEKQRFFSVVASPPFNLFSHLKLDPGPALSRGLATTFLRGNVGCSLRGRHGQTPAGSVRSTGGLGR